MEGDEVLEAPGDEAGVLAGHVLDGRGVAARRPAQPLFQDGLCGLREHGVLTGLNMSRKAEVDSVLEHRPKRGILPYILVGLR